MWTLPDQHVYGIIITYILRFYLIILVFSSPAAPSATNRERVWVLFLLSFCDFLPQHYGNAEGEGRKLNSNFPHRPPWLWSKCSEKSGPMTAVRAAHCLLHAGQTLRVCSASQSILDPWGRDDVVGDDKSGMIMIIGVSHVRVSRHRRFIYTQYLFISTLVKSARSAIK